MTSELDPRDDAGRALYDERLKVLPGLAQPPAPPWDELDESVRERWRNQAEGSNPGPGHTSTTTVTSENEYAGFPHAAHL